MQQSYHTSANSIIYQSVPLSTGMNEIHTQNGLLYELNRPPISVLNRSRFVSEFPA